MAMSKGIQIKAALVLGLALFLFEVEGRANRGLAAGGPAVFDVTKHGAKGNGEMELDEDGEPVNNIAFIQAFQAACQSAGPAKVVIPPGKFVIGQVLFVGPCKSPAVTVEVQGTLLASTDPSNYPSSDWLLFENLDGVTLTGNGTLDGQGADYWKSNDCATNPSCAPPPTSIKFNKANNSVIEGIKSVNSMSFHIFVTASRGVTVRNVNLSAPATSVMTEGVHVTDSNDVNVLDSIIGTGDDCVSFGKGSTNVSAVGITCGPGFGISVGNLGKEDGELEVKDVKVRNCTFKGTLNGARVRSFSGPKPGQASGIVFEDLMMDNVKNPIVIDQGPENQVSNVKINDVTFRNIKGTSATNSVVSFACSKSFPCEGVQVADVNVKPLNGLSAAKCLNTKVIFGGRNDGLAC